MEDRQWKQATRVLLAAEATTASDDDRRHTLELLAVAAADGKQHQVSSDAVYALKDTTPRPVSTWIAYAQVALARRNFLHADAAARSAVLMDATSGGGWTALATSYAGLGWFDEATSCLDRINRDDLTAVEEWRLGRAVNQWATTATPMWAIGAASVLLVGTLSVAIVLLLPLVVRSLRLRRLAGIHDGSWFEDRANKVWQSRRGARFAHGAAIVAALLGHVYLFLTF